MSKSSWRRVFIVLGAALLLGGYGYSAASNGGIDVYSGGIDMHSNDIVDGGTTVWNANKGYVPSSQVQDSFLKNTGDEATGVLYTSAGLKIGGNSGEQKIWADGAKSSNYLNLWNGALHSGVSLDLVADSDRGNGGSYVWTISESDGSLEMEYGSDIHVSGDDEGMFIADFGRGEIKEM